MIDRRAARTLLAAGCALALSGMALAAETSHDAGAHAAASHDAPANPMSFEIVPFISTLVVFGVAAFVLGKYVWPKIIAGLRDRERKISGEIESAEKARKQAADALAQYERSLADARAEAAAMLDRTRADQQRLALELKAKADAELSAMRDAATRDIETAKKEAIGELYAQAATLASEIAAKVLKREINAEDHRRLIDDSLGELESAGRR